MTTRIEAIAFDLDGTLIDSAGGVAHALNAGLRDAGLAGFDLSTVRSWIGDGPDALIARALAAQAMPPAQAREVAPRVRLGFDAATLRAPMTGSHVFDGIAVTVSALAAAYPLVVVTNKPTPLARAVLQEAGLLSHFGDVHGADDTSWRKPSPRLIQHAASRLGLPADRWLMVGDADVDIAAAHAAGCRAAWAGWGYGSATSAERPPAWRLREPTELLALLARVGRAPPSGSEQSRS